MSSNSNSDDLRLFNVRRKYLINLKKMFYSHELLSLRHKGRLARCWLAASVNDQIFRQMCKSSTVNGINLCDLCNEIISIVQTKSNEANRRFSLYLSAQLMYGAVKILSYQTKNLQNLTFQIDKNALCHRKSETYEIQNNSTDFKSCNVTSLVKDYNSQLDSNLLGLQDKFNINNKMEVMMHDATCLDFGALTHEQLNFLHSNDDDTSLEVFDRMHITNLNLDDELNDTLSDNEKILADFENTELLMHKDEMEISISPIHNDTLVDQVHQGTFVKGMLPKELILEMEPGKSDLVTPQKRQSKQEKHIETPTKKRRDQPDVDKIVTEPIPEPVAVTTSVTEHPLELPHNLELPQKDLLEIEKKVRKKKVFSDKNTQLSHKTIKTWLSNVNVCIMPLNIPNMNMPMSDILFKTPSTSFNSIHQRKWNNSLSALFHMHTIASPGRKMIPMEYGELLDKSTEFTRFENKDNKTEELFSELSSALGKSAEISKNITSEKSITITMDEFPQVSKVHDILESITDIPEVLPSLHITEDTLIPDTSHNPLSSLSSCLITKRELLVLLEVIWQNTEFATFSDIVSSDHYSRLDASSCFTFLLEFHKERTVILKQAAPYDIIYIQKYT